MAMIKFQIKLNNKDVSDLWDVQEIHVTDTNEKVADQLDLKIHSPSPADGGFASLDFKKGDSLSVSVNYGDTGLFLGEFIIDRYVFIEKEMLVDIGAISALWHEKGQWKKKRYIKYSDTTLQTLVGSICQRNGYPLIFGGTDVVVGEVRQRESDAKFLRKLADEAGFYLKFYKKRVIFQSLDLAGNRVVREGQNVKMVSGTGQRYIEISGDDTVEGFNYTWQAAQEDSKEKIEYKPFEEKFNKLVLQSQDNEGIDVGVEAGLYNVLPIEKNVEAAAVKAGLEEYQLNFALDATNPKISGIAAGTIIYISGTWLVTNVRHSINYIDGWRSDYRLRRLSGEEIPTPTRKQKTTRRKAQNKKKKDLLGKIQSGTDTTLDYLDYAEGKIDLVDLI